MKRVIVLLITLMVMICVSLFADVGKEEAENIVFNIVGDNIENVEIYMEENIISDSIFEIDNLRSLTSPYSNYWLFFIDDIPLAMWYHDCRYIMVNVLDGTYMIFDEKFPMCKYKTNLEEVSVPEITEPSYEPYTNPDPIETRDPDPNKYALIINTGNWDNPNRFWNDMSTMYCALKENNGFIDENIFVYSLTFNELWDGDISHDLDKDDIDDIDGPCFKDDIMARCDWFANNLGPDDQLFVYVESHGLNNGNDSYVDIYEGLVWMIDHWTLLHYNLYDSELAEWLTPINCGEMITMVMACHSGGFKDKLSDYSTYDVQCENRVIHTATNIEHNAWTGIGVTFGFCEFAYYWTTAIRGRHAHHSNPWVPSHNIGEHIYLPHDFDPDNPAGGGLPGDPPNEGNNDGIRQFGEVFEYSIYMDQYCDYKGFIGILPNREFPLVASEIGFVDDVLSMYGYGGDITHSQTVSGDFNFVTPVKIGPEVTLIIDDGSNLTVYEDNSLTLFGRSLLEVTNGSKFQLEDGSCLYGTDHTVYENPTTGQRYDTWVEAYQNIPNIGAEHEIPGDRVIINNDGRFCAIGYWDRITINSVGDGYAWDGFEFNNSIFCNNIRYCDVSKISHINVNNAGLLFDNSTFSHCGQICARDGSAINIFKSIIDSNSACPIVSYGSCNEIRQCAITNNDGNGISVYYPSVSSNVISANYEIQNNSYWGISYYDTPVFSMYNNIVENGSHGLVALGSSGTPVLAGNLISNNVGAELISNRWCFPDLTSYIGTYGPNTIEDDVNSGGADNYLLMCGNYDGNRIDVRGNNFPNEDDDDFEDRFYPFYNAYIFDGEKPPEKILYEEGIAEIADSVYESAKLTMKNIVDIYPETETAKNALQWIMYLEKFSGHDYVSLRDYIENIDDVSYPHLEITKYNTITSTYMAEKDYEAAITRLEAILADPPSVADSIFAYIDQGYCYLKLDEQGGKADPVECKFKPRSFNEFKYVSQNLTKNLLDKAIPTSEPPTTDPQTIEFVLHQNYPNPASLSTTFSFSIPANTKNAELKIFNIKGQLVKTFIPKSNEKGTTDNFKWDCKDETGRTLSNGIYFYKLTADKKEIVKKMVLIK